jgi:inositol transport system permease protein
MELAFAVALLVAMGCNLLNAVMVAQFNTPAFIATLAMQEMARGSALLFSKGQNIYQIGDYTRLGRGSLGFIPIPLLFLVGLFLVTWYILNNTRFGRGLYAIGGNQEAAKASGINVKATKITAFLINGLFVGVAGVLFMSRVNAGLPNGANQLRVPGAHVVHHRRDELLRRDRDRRRDRGGGAFIVGFLNNIMNLASVNSYMQQIIRGAIIALAVIYDIWTKNRRTRRLVRGMAAR